MITTSDIKKGLCIRYSNDIYKIIEFLHVKPGKGPAFVRTKLKSVSTGKVVDNTFTAGHKIDDVRVENRKYQFLYKDGETYHFMNSDDYNQIEVDKSQIEADIFLKEIDSAIVMHNASTQFADGGEFGMGAEIGIATGRFHARGPVGVEQLTSFKYVVRGSGQIRP